MSDLIAIALTVAVLVGSPFAVVWFSQVGAADPVPFSYAKVALLGFSCCVVVIWSVMAFAPSGGAPAVANWGLGVSLRWLASVAFSCALAMLAPVLVAYGSARSLSRRGALLSAAALGVVNLASFVFFFGTLSCVVFFAC